MPYDTSSPVIAYSTVSKTLNRVKKIEDTKYVNDGFISSTKLLRDCSSPSVPHTLPTKLSSCLEDC